MGWVGAAIAGSAILGYMGSKESSAQQQRQFDQNALATKEGRAWQSNENLLQRGYQDIQGALQRGYQSANTDTQRRDIWNSMDANIKAEQARYDTWTKLFGDTRDNIREYYKNLSTDSVIGKAHQALEVSYANALQQIQNKYAERGITPKSGFYNAAEMSLDISKAQESAKIVASAEEQVLNAKNNYAQSQQNDRYLTRAKDLEKFKTINANVSDNTNADIKNTTIELQNKYRNNEITAKDMRDKLSELYGAEGAKYFDAVGIGDRFNYIGNDFSKKLDSQLNATRTANTPTSTYTGYNIEYGMKYKDGYDKNKLLNMYKTNSNLNINDYITEYEKSKTQYDNTPKYGTIGTIDSIGSSYNGDSGIA